MAGKNPAEHHAGLFPAEAIGGELHRRRHGRDPVEAVEHREQRQAVEREIGERQIEQRQPAQAVIPEQQPAIVEAVGQPAGADGADEIEDAHHRQHARRGDGRQPVIVAQRDEMGLDQAVGAAAADEERAEQHPEDRRAGGLLQHERAATCSSETRPTPAAGGGDTALLAVKRQAEIARPVAHQGEGDDTGERQHAADDRPARSASRKLVVDLRDQRQEHQLPGGVAGREQAHDQAAAVIEPARRHRHRKHHGGEAGADADDDAPQQNELPHLRHRQRCQQAGRDQDHGGDHHGAHAEPVHEGGGERAEQSEQHEAQRQRRGNLLGVPAELVLAAARSARRACSSPRR